MLEQVHDLLGVLFLALIGYIVFYKSAIAVFWWPVVAPILEPLGFRLVCMDMSYGIYSVRYVGRDTDA